ncbi:MAG: PAS domain S-box protein [Deferribacterales bacterium]
MELFKQQLQEFKKRLDELADRPGKDAVAALVTEVFGCDFFDISCFIDDKEIFQAMLDTMPVPVYYKDTKGVYLACNQALCDLYGLKREEVIGNTAYKFFSKEIADSFAEGDRILISEGSEERVNHRGRFPGMADGFHVIQKRAFFINGKVQGIIGVIMDLTEQKMVEDRAWVSEAFFKSLFETSPMPIILINSFNIIVDLNDTAEKFFIGSETLAGQDASAVFCSYSDYENVMSAANGISRAKIHNCAGEKEEVITMLSSSVLGGETFHAVAFVRTDI